MVICSMIAMHTQKSKRTVTPKIWKRDEILTFLDIFESTFHASVVDPFESEEDMWKCVADKLLEQGITATVQQCINKWNILYKTYANNLSRQGVFYAKVKQIVEFSQELNEPHQSVQTVTDEQVVEYDTEISIKNESPNDDGHPEEIDEIVRDNEESHEQIEETISNQEHLKQITISDFHDTPPDDQCDSSLEPADTETCTKKIKLSDEAYADANFTNDPPPTDAPVPAEENENLRDILNTILNKINAIQAEQISQGRRIACIEKLQDEHRSILLDIKRRLEFK